MKLKRNQVVEIPAAIRTRARQEELITILREQATQARAMGDEDVAEEIDERRQDLEENLERLVELLGVQAGRSPRPEVVQ